jgi:hypothetical protein
MNRSNEMRPVDSLGWRPPTSAARCEHPEHVTRFEPNRALVRQALGAAFVPSM